MTDMTASSAASTCPIVDASTPDAIKVLDVKHWTDRLFSFTVARPASFRFRSGEFVMIGLLNEVGKPLLRAYSIASPFWEDTLTFYSIKVQDGPLTSRLQHIEADDHIIMRPKPVGTLVLDALTSGSRLYLVSTGTGVAPFASLLRDPDIYERFEQVILTHTCRDVAELAYSADLVERTKTDPLVGEMAADKLIYYPTTTREPSNRMGRVTNLMESGVLFDDLGLPHLSAETDKVMICGSMAMNLDMKQFCSAAGLSEGANSKPGDFVVEKAFVG
ncbi:MAG: ferredoxin--NADP reductase [Alphaproteobacteria bacterium]|nr:ferredoxin--NADP reductase [Alphaproteobacteria bacterium]